MQLADYRDLSNLSLVEFLDAGEATGYGLVHISVAASKESCLYSVVNGI